MGGKFANINVKCSDIDAVKAFFPDYTVKMISDGWVTVASEKLQWGDTRGPAKKLSAALPCPVVTTEYFDDDYVELAVFLGGKRAARHVPAEYEGFPRVVGRPGAWRDALNLTESDEKALKTVFREENPEGCLRLLEGVLGCPLWVEEETIDQIRAPDRTCLDRYLARKDAESGIENQTRLSLSDELPGSFERGGTTLPIMSRDDTGLAAFWGVRDGRFHRLGDVSFPPSERTAAGEWQESVLSQGMFLAFFQGPNWKNTVYTISEDGGILDKYEYIDTGCVSDCSRFLDRDRIIVSGVCRNIRTHENEWDIGVRHSAYGVYAPLLLPGGRLVFCYDRGAGKASESFLVTVGSDGKDMRSRRLQSIYHWKMPAAAGDRLLLGCERTLTCYDPSLEELWSMKLDQSVWQAGLAVVDGNTLYMFTYDRVTAIDLAGHQVTALREIPHSEDCFMAGVLPGVGPIVTNGGSVLQVWDRELKPVSRHRVKGDVVRVLSGEGRTFVLAFSDARSASGAPEGGAACIRMYELTKSRGKIPRPRTGHRS